MTMPDATIRPFEVHVPDEDLADLRRRLTATRWPGKELVADRSQGGLLPDGFAGRPGSLDARSRHRQLREDLARLCRRAALRQPDPGQDPRQHHAVLADR